MGGRAGLGMQRNPLHSKAVCSSCHPLPGLHPQAKVTADGKAGFFAIASPPDVNNSGVLELLVKRAPGSTADLICNLAAGAELLVSPVQVGGLRKCGPMGRQGCALPFSGLES